MDSERWRRLRDLVGEALELGPEERPPFLDRECGGDEELRREVEELLDLEDPTDFLDDSAFRPDADQEVSEERRLGRYELIRSIGRGAMASVWLARHSELDHEVAIKVLELGPATRATQLARFEREPKRIAKLEHPHIVRVFDVGRDGGVCWFAMERVDGHDLAHELSRTLKRNPHHEPILPRVGESGRFRAIATVIRDAASALHAAHQAGIVHRDVKPSNLLIDRETGTVKLTDFGIARDESLGTLTMPGQTPGTPQYMSPEQARALSEGIDHRTDVYSLGVVLYECLALRRPYESETYDALRRAICEREPPTLLRDRAIPRDLAAIAHQAIEKDADHRYQDAGEMAADLDRFLEHEPVQAQTRGALVRTWRRLTSYRRELLRSAAVAVVAVLAWLSISEWIDRGDVEALRDRLASRDLRDILRDETSEADFGALLDLKQANDALWFPDLIVEQRLADLRRRLELDLPNRIAALERLAPLESEAQIATLWVEASRSRELFPQSALLQSVGSPNRLRARVSVEPRPGSPYRVRSIRVHERNPMDGTIAPTGAIWEPRNGDTELIPGSYRFVLRFEGGSGQEFDRTLGLGERMVLPITNCPRELLLDPTEYRAIPASRLPMSERQPETGAPLISGFGGPPVELADYEIYRREVTVREFDRFLRACPEHPEPPLWESVRKDLESLGGRPVVYVTFNDARTYAEWRGARLPSPAEWRRAACGPNDYDFPWGNETPDGDWPSVVGRQPTPEYPECLRAPIVDADSAEETATIDHGLLHTLGNVCEWSSVCAADIEDGRLTPKPELRVYLGFAAESEEPEDQADRSLNLKTPAVYPDSRHARGSYLGFRLVRTSSR